MNLGSEPHISRRHFVCGCCGGAVIACVPTLARGEDRVVPARLEPRHHNRFENEYLRVLEIMIEPGDTTLFHEHALDAGYVDIQAAELRNEELNNPTAKIIQTKTGGIRFSNYQKEQPFPYIHRVTVLSRQTFILLGFEIINPLPGGFAVSDRSAAPAYHSELDNNRVRAWRLKLDSGQATPPITQSGPGLRVFLTGDQLIENVDGGPEREIRVKPGGFEWQPPGRTRSLRNTGTSQVELAEYELR